MRERWGTFSVRDHINKAPFVSEVLLYDRLVIPIPVPNDEQSQAYWKHQKWAPASLEKCLKILKVKSDESDGLALTVHWDETKRERFKNKMSTASALATQARSPDQSYYDDPFQATRELIKNEFRPALPKGVSKAWTVAAYPSSKRFQKDVAVANPDRKIQLAAVLTHRFFTPAVRDPDHEFLKRAVALSTSPGFSEKRTKFYEWQENLIEEKITDEKAIEELDQLLNEYNQSAKKAFTNIVARYAFTVIPIGLSIAGAVLAGSELGRVIAATSGVVQLTRSWRFEKRP